MTRYRKSVDANQAEVVAALRAAGWTVKDCHALGGGVFDLAVRKDDFRAWVEVKMQGEKLTAAEKEFEEWGPGMKFVVYGAEAAVEKLNGLWLWARGGKL